MVKYAKVCPAPYLEGAAGQTLRLLFSLSPKASLTRNKVPEKISLKLLKLHKHYVSKKPKAQRLRSNLCGE